MREPPGIVMSASLPEGSLVSDRYEVISLLGGGTATEVYEVRDIIGNRTLAMKMLREDADKEAEVRLSREFYHLSRFSHAGIIQAIDYGTTHEHRPYFVMEFFPGKPLNRHFAKGYAPELESVTVQVLRALDSIHAQGLIHCDLKPENVLVAELDGEPVAKLLDFGFAERLTIGEAIEPRGTLGYVAPEVFKGADADARADLYSLGMILYEVVTGTGPSSEKSIRDWLRRQYFSELPSPRKANPDIPERFEAVLLSLTHKNPDRRPRSAAAVIRALNGSEESPEQAGPRKYLMAPAFVGRGEYLSGLRDALRDGAQSRARVVCVSGERGVGKSRLMSEFKFLAQLEGATIFSFEPGSLGARPQSLVEALLGYLRVYARADLPSDDEAERASATGEGKYRLFETVTQRLKDLAGSHRVSHSLVIIVDDFELFDPTSLEFLRYLGFSLDKDRITILVCGLKERRFLDLIAEFGRTGHSAHISLPTMTGEETAGLAASLLGEVNDSPALAKWLVQATGGNPLFAIETVHALIDGRVLLFRNGRWVLELSSLDAYRPPETVTDVVQRRLDNLTAEELEVLRIGAASGGPFTIEFLRAVVGIDERVLFNAIGRLKALGLLRTFAAEGGAALVLSSKILEAVITGRLSVEERRENHRRVALALELLYPEKQDKLVFDLAHHYAQAGIADRAYACSVRAGRRARDYQLSEQALGFFETALALSAGTAPVRERLELIETVGELREATGKYAEAIDIYTQGMSLVVSDRELPSRKDLLARLLRRLGLVHQRLGQSAEALNFFNQALLMHPDRASVGYIQLLDDLGWSYCAAQEFNRAEDLLTQALHLADRLKPTDAEAYNRMSARTLYYFGVMSWTRQDHVLALQLAERSLGIYESIRDDHNVGKVSQFIATLWWRRGELDKAKDYYLKYLPAQRKGAEVSLLLRTLQGLGLISQDEGEWDRAYDYLDEALRIAQRIGDAPATIDLESGIGSVCDERGEWDEALRHFGRADEVLAASGQGGGYEKAVVRANRARILGRRGLIDEAEQELAGALEQAEQLADANLGFFVLLYQAELALLAERNDTARQRIIRAGREFRRERDWRQRAAFRDVASQFRLAHGDFARALADATRALAYLKDKSAAKEQAQALRNSGLARYALDRHERGAAEIKRSIELLKASGSTYELGRSLYASARALARQTPGERTVDFRMPVSFRPVPPHVLTEALANLKQAEEVFRRLGARIDLARTEELAEALTQVSATMQLKARERGEYLKVFYRLSELMSLGLDKEDFAERVLDLVIEVTRAERGVLFLAHGSKLVPAAARSVDQATVEDAKDVSQSVLRKVRRRGELVFSADAMSDPRFSAANSVMLNRIRSMLCAPLRTENKVIGTIYLDSRVTAHLFLEEDKNLLMSVANLLGATIDRSQSFQRLQEEMSTQREDVPVDDATGFFIGRSRAMREVYQVVDQIAETDCTVLLTGETGTGKGVIAQLIHARSERRGRALVTINCGALPEPLLESELFGHVRGAFTGAVRDKTGLFETAEGGTAFLDEITNTTLNTQGKLLQVLEEKTIRRLGDTETKRVDIRLICATNVDLRKEVEAGRFRQDLFYRMNVVSIEVPPLRDRTGDVPQLAGFFVKRCARQLNKPVIGFEPPVLRAFSTYRWPGNVREMANVIERAAIMTQKRRITLEDLGAAFANLRAEQEEVGTRRRRGRAVDREAIIKALRAHDGNVTRAADSLATHRRQLQRLIQRYAIDRSDLS
ncbi:MAG: sigma 54-interacting transcriptional regulator [bacterium]